MNKTSESCSQPEILVAKIIYQLLTQQEAPSIYSPFPKCTKQVN